MTGHILRCAIDWYPLEFKVWDLKSVLQENNEDLVPIHVFNESTQRWYETRENERDAILEKFKIFIDDYQMSFLITWEFDTIQRIIPTPMIYVIRFDEIY